MTKKCKICGKEFEATNPRYVICSPECRKENSRRVYHALDAETKKLKTQQSKERYRRKVKGFPCKFCGKEVKPIVTDRFHRYRWHEDCLIAECMKAIKNGEPFTDATKIAKFALNKGYTKADIIEFAKERGIE